MSLDNEIPMAVEAKLRALKWRKSCGCALTGVRKGVLTGLPPLAKAKRKTKVELYLERTEAAVAGRVHAALVKQRKRVIHAVVIAYSRTQKLTADEQRVLDDLMTQVDARGVGVAVAESFGDDIRTAFRRAGITALAEVGIEAGDEIVAHVDVAATLFAAQRSAELVTAVSDTTRSSVRDLVGDALGEGWSTDKLSDALQESVSFSEYRATMVARTELAFAHVQGNLDGWKQSGAVAEKQWLASAGACPICEAMNGVTVALDDTFDYDGEDIEGPPGHPNCRCDVLPVLKDEEE